MAVKISKPTVNLRAELARLAGYKPAPAQETFWFSGNTTQTTFPLLNGWKPKHVYVDGSLYRPGAGEDYEVVFDGFTYSVEMAVAPANVDVAIMAEREV